MLNEAFSHNIVLFANENNEQPYDWKFWKVQNKKLIDHLEVRNSKINFDLEPPNDATIGINNVLFFKMIQQIDVNNIFSQI
jgi:hypothetical protein